MHRRVVEQMLVGGATRQHGRSLEPLGPDVRTRGTSKSAGSRRCVAQTQAQLDAWRATPLARRLDTDHPSAATRVREGLDETLTILGFGLSERLQRSLATTHAAESLLSRTRHVKRNVTRGAGRRDGATLGRRRGAGSDQGLSPYQRL